MWMSPYIIIQPDNTLYLMYSPLLDQLLDNEVLKLPSLFAAWLIWIFHTKSHNMKALVILSHSWSPFLPPTCLRGIIERLWVSVWPSGFIFVRKKLPSDYPCKSHDHAHQWAVLVMAWLLYDKRKCEHNIVRLVCVYILRSACQWVHMALAIKRPDILLM